MALGSESRVLGGRAYAMLNSFLESVWCPLARSGGLSLLVPLSL
jgi:hypothetical protein